MYKGPKLRVVFDAAAPFKEKCLNDTILSGQALQPVLPAVLIQFREREVAWAADVEAMFSRFRLRPADANYFCFLWREVEPKQSYAIWIAFPLEQHVHLSSPSIPAVELRLMRRRMRKS